MSGSNSSSESDISHSGSSNIIYENFNSPSSYKSRTSSTKSKRRTSLSSLISQNSIFAADPAVTSFKVFSGIEHYRPDENTTYFAPLKPVEKDLQPRICTVVFPFFNESKTELQRSLQAMYKQAIDTVELNIEVHVVAIMDGWWKASPEMIDYVKEMFPPTKGTEADPWWNHILSIPEKSDLVETYVLQRLTPDGFAEEVDVGDEKMMNLSLIIKRDNRRKHNSHEWFFQCYSLHYDSEYAFATDCGTLYAKKCVYYLIKYMDENPKVAASTGRQRVMSSAMQGCEDESLLAVWYRAGQAYDYEASISSFQGAFSLIGMLPVLPGPCGMYRYTDIKGECLDYYFDTVNISPEDTTMVTGNLLLAEDRILSYAAALITGKFTTWVPHAIFYFEAETDSNKFISQRRRWTNGSFAGYIYLLLTNRGLLFDSSHTWYFKAASFVLLLLQLLMFLLVSISPAIFMSMSFFAVAAIAPKENDISRYVQYGVFGVYALLYLVFVFFHSREKFVPQLYYPALIINAFLLLLIMCAIIISIVYGDWIVVVVVGLIMGTPFVLSFLHSLESFVMMITTFIPFMFFLPTFVAWFAAYSFSRTWDLSWGNRPSDTMDSVSKKDRDEKLNGMKRTGMKITCFLALLNISIGVALTFLKGANAFIWISLSISFPSLIQMFLSFFFYLLYTPHHSLAIVFNLLGRSRMKSAGLIFLLTSWILNLCSLLSSDWVSRTGTITFYPPARSYVGHYGVLFNCINMPGISFGEGPENTVVVAGNYCATYGNQLSTDFPCGAWSLTMILLVVTLLFSGIAIFAISVSGFMLDTSRADAISIMYTVLSAVLIAAGILMFPSGLGAAGFTRYTNFYWLLQDEESLCGEESGAFKAGLCSIGSGYITYCCSLPFTILAAYCFISGQEDIPIHAMKKLDEPKPVKRQTVQEKVLIARLERIESMVSNGSIVLEVDDSFKSAESLPTKRKQDVIEFQSDDEFHSGDESD